MPEQTHPATTDTAPRWVALARRLQHVLTHRWTRRAFLAATVAGGLYALAVQRTTLAASLGEVRAGALLSAAGLVVAGLIATMQVWRVLLAGLGAPLRPLAAAQTFFVGQLAKYLPGSMWSVLAQMELARAHHVPRSRTATAAALTIAVSLGAGLLTTVVALPFAGDQAGSRSWWLLLGVPLLAVLLHPKLVNGVVGAALRLARRPPMPKPLSGRTIVAAAGWAVLSWVLLGAHVAALGRPLGADTLRAAAVSVGGFALAWCLGFLMLVAPAGVGVREVLLVGLLGTQLTVAQATAVTVLSRALMTAADLALAGAAAAAVYVARRRDPSPDDGTTRGTSA
ncbi:flippase-like domain-containing protein [Dactylosporangium sp. AC04546]|uniref:flippase-like domain-containing protein n=1 Tax=Dactylosporangium sp. AC04546 TaxID=2862460 RepID=UPI001EE0B652|nr:flippase-like domain-containing protein [Dactylosporangium sp. AC04546]WVK89151.1 flippase-like domain-containing protein [Dactylosporangium sp. AC04546]